MIVQEITINTPFIKLDQFLKWIGVAMSGGEAKVMIQSGMIRVNGEIETRIRKKLFPEDQIKITEYGIYKIVINNHP